MNYLPRELWNYLEEPPGDIQNSYAYQVLHGYLRWAHRQGWGRYGLLTSQRKLEGLDIWSWFMQSNESIAEEDLLTSLDRIYCYIIAVSYNAMLYGWDLIRLLHEEGLNYSGLPPDFVVAGMIAARMGRLKLARKLMTEFRFTPDDETMVLASSIDVKFARSLMPYISLVSHGDALALVVRRDEVELFLLIKDAYVRVCWINYFESVLGKSSPSKILAYVREHGL